jgi:UDP-N-acetylmuramoylalanine--D-glutamate ligase
MRLHGLKVLVAGLGKSGKAAIDLLVEKGAHPHGTDSRGLESLPGVGPFLERLGVPFSLQGEAPFTDVDLIVVSPGVPLDLPEIARARAKSIPVIGELELAGWFLRGRAIGITGSNGKTTTTTLVGHILKSCGIPCQVGGNIGIPPSAMIAASREDQWNVLELSSFQLETIESFRVDIAVCLNVTADHLDRHASFDAYAAAKRRLFETQRPGDWAVLNRANPVTAGWGKRLPGAPVWFSLQDGTESDWRLERDWIVAGAEAVMPVSEIPILGRHNIENVMAAAASAKLTGAPLGSIRASVRNFPGVEHRIEFVRETGGVRYYNDSKATNVDAALKAIDAFDGGLWIILGGKDKGSDYTPLAAALRGKVRGALLIGAAAGKIASQLSGIPALPCGDLETAVGKAAGLARPGDIVLLAPACASFDQFQNYEERGRMFKTFVASIV